MLITKLNPQNPDFAESDGSGGKAKKQTEFVLSKQPTFLAKQAFTNFFNRIKLKGKFAPFFESFIVRKSLFCGKSRDEFSFSIIKDSTARCCPCYKIEDI